MFVIGFTLFRIIMDREWKLGRLADVMVVYLLCLSLRLSWCLNDEGAVFWVSGILRFSCSLFVSREVKENDELGIFCAGLALLRFRDRVVSDPFGALSNWKDEDGVVDPCSWFGIECSDGKVVAL